MGSLCSQYKDPLISVYAKRLKSTHSPSWQEGDYQLWLQCSSESVARVTNSIHLPSESAWGSMQTLWEVFQSWSISEENKQEIPWWSNAKTPWSQCRGPGFQSLIRELVPWALTKTWCSQINKRREQTGSIRGNSLLMQPDQANPQCLF